MNLHVFGLVIHHKHASIVIQCVSIWKHSCMLLLQSFSSIWLGLPPNQYLDFVWLVSTSIATPPPGFFSSSSIHVMGKLPPHMVSNLCCFVHSLLFIFYVHIEIWIHDPLVRIAFVSTSEFQLMFEEQCQLLCCDDERSFTLQSIKTYPHHFSFFNMDTHQSRTKCFVMPLNFQYEVVDT